MNKPYEILAPAGNFEALQAAVQNGADAVYLAGKEFGARKYANNFSNDELIEAVKYCHIRGVYVYVTVNTLVLNHELDKIKRYLDFLYTIGVDAVIVQDIGILDYIRKTYPELHIHCSTQMSVQTAEDIKFLESLGVSRVILGREMSVEDIKRAKKAANVELEAFVHGALCISVSGQCLMSSMIGGRSGNRGNCAQPCRQKYSLYRTDTGEKYESSYGEYLLSPKDLCAIEDIKEIIDAGVFSLKLEGRMKSAEYVAAVVRVYRSMIEAIYHNRPADVKALKKELKIFNRGFTRGHLFQESGLKLMSMTSPGNQGYYLGDVVRYNRKTKKVTIALKSDLNHNDEIQIRRTDEVIGGRVERLEYNGAVVKECAAGSICDVNFKHISYPGEQVYKTFDQKQMKRLKQTFSKEFLEIPVNMKAVIKRDAPIVCSLSDGTYTVSEETEYCPRQAQSRAITSAEIKAHLSKLGGTPYKSGHIDIWLDPGLAVPVKIINGIRRTLVDKLNQRRINRYDRKSKLTPQIIIEKDSADESKTMGLTYSVRNVSQLAKLIELGAEIIYYKDLKTLESAFQTAKKKNYSGKLVPEIFRLATDAELHRIKQVLQDLHLDTLLVQSYGHMHMFEGFKLIGDFNLNVINDYSYQFYLNRCLKRVTLSLELNLEQISAMNTVPSKTEVLGYGYFPVMVMKHCAIAATLKNERNCGLCDNVSFCLKDKRNENFRIIRRSGCSTEIYNSKKLMLMDYCKTLESKGVGYFRLNFLDETAEQIDMIVNLHRKMFSSELSDEDVKKINRLKKSGITYGHLTRGVE